MKSDDPVPVAGDVIGNTAYSQRFVLKILLNLTNGTKFSEKIAKGFEDDLCTLWDMTTEKDVALFLLEHDALNLIHFALPTSSPRIKEILVGIIGNMCCQKRVAAALLLKDSLLSVLFEYLKSDETSILIQLLRLLTTCLYMAEPDDLVTWMNTFIATEHSTVLYFILEYSADKELLYGAIEHFNAICGYFNTESHRKHFFKHFVRVEALKSLITSFKEITENQSGNDEKQDLELAFVRSLHIAINLVGFENSQAIFGENIEDILIIISSILTFYADKIIDEKEFDSDLIDIIDTINTLVKMLKLNEISEPDQYFKQTFKIWKTIHILTAAEKSSDFEDSANDLEDVALKLKGPLSILLCLYIAKCSEENLSYVLDYVGKDYEGIINTVKDKELASEVSKRSANAQMRLIETGHS